MKRSLVLRKSFFACLSSNENLHVKGNEAVIGIDESMKLEGIQINIPELVRNRSVNDSIGRNNKHN